MHLQLKVECCIGLVHSCTNYGYMQSKTKDIHDKEELSSNDMSYGKSR